MGTRNNKSFQLDKSFEKVIYSPVCMLCKHLIDPVDHKCAAFASIPDVIWDGHNDHRLPYPGDNGITFEPIDQKHAKDLA